MCFCDDLDIMVARHTGIIVGGSGTSVVIDDLATGEAPAAPKELTVIGQKRQAIRVFRHLENKLVYALAYDGTVRYLNEVPDAYEGSGNYSGEDELIAAVEKGELVELVQPEPAVEPDDEEDLDVDEPFNQTRAINDRLIAAQDETGFKLFDIVKNKVGGEYGKVLGFGRVNFQNGVARALLVEFSGVSPDDSEIIALSPLEVEYVASQVAYQPPF